MSRLDLYDFKFSYKFKKGDVVVYNNVIFKDSFIKRMQYLNLVIDVDESFIRLNKTQNFYSWWEIVPASGFERVSYWVRFYIWYYTRFKRM